MRCIFVHRQAEYLPTALESVRCQPADVQLAVLDASPDDSAQSILVPYRDAFVRKRLHLCICSQELIHAPSGLIR
jgi:hypothetical protein